MSSERSGGRPLVHGPVTGVRIASAAATTAVDLLGADAALGAEEALARLGAPASGDFDPARFERTSGVRTRHWVRGAGAGPAELGALAARRALDAAEWSATDLGLVVAATSTPVAVSRCLAREIGKLLGTDAPALDVRAGGAGGLEAWIVGATRTAAAGRCLVIAAECLSLYANRDDPRNALLFGDGAAALCLEPGPDAEGLVAARSRSFDAGGSPFTVAGRIDVPGDLAFASPSADYAGRLGEVWALEGEALRALADDHGAEFALAPYAVSAKQLDALEAAAGLVASHARARLSRCGSLGCAGPLASAADLLEQDPRASLAAIAVGGGIASCSLLWRGRRAVL